VRRKLIKDEFTDLPISRQRKYQLRMHRDKRCITCGEPALGKWRCLRHLVETRERTRKTLGCKRRCHKAHSYNLEAKAKAAAQMKRSKKAS
jgi:hypothetical protein